MFLVPTFQPPPTSIGRNLSQFQHLDFLLAANQHRQQLRPQLQHQVNTTAQQTAPRNATTAKQGDLEDDCFNLFGGDIVVENVQALNQTKSALTVPHVQKELWSRSSDKGPTSSKFRLLANLLDKDVDNDTGKTTKRKDDGEPVVTKGASVAQQSQKRARQNGQVASATDVVFETTDFVGIERLCRNAGGSLDGLRSFVRKAQSSSVVAITVLFQCLTTNHCTTTVKYCTQSSSCRHWNCICDRHVRSTYVVDNVMGVVVRIPAEPETLYFLPLMNCLDNREAASSPEQGSKRKLLPMQCSSSLSERVGALSEVFAHPGTEKVVFNAQVALIPVLHQIALYAGQSTPSESQKEEAPTRHVNCLQMVANLFDPRIGAYLCDSDISEAQLELESLLDKYPQVKVRGATDVGEASSVATAWGASASASSKQAESGRIPIPNHDLVGLGSVARAVQRIKGELDSLLGLQAILATEMTKMGIARIFHEIEMPMTCLLAAIEHRGVVVDVDFLSSQRSAVAQKINIIESEIFAAIAPAQPFNVASPEQVSHVLFEVLHLPPPAQTSKKGKHHSTSEEDLLRIRQCHPVVDLILSYRALAKISSTYVDGLRPFVCKENAELHQVLHSFPSFAVDTPYPGYPELPENRPVLSFFDSTVATTATSQGAPPDAFAVLMGTARSSAQTASAAQLSAQLEAQLEHRIHAYWQQTIVRTGRLSCTKPNLQNIPNKQNIAGMEVNMRCAFKATQGCLLVSADYSQIEMRVLAHLCQDSVLLNLFRHSEGYDIYRHLAARIFRKPVAEVTEEERTKAKVICLGVLYGMGPQAAAAKLGISVEAASRITQTFFDNFKQIKTWIQQIKAQAKQHGYVRTLLGRLRHLPDLRSADPAKSSYAERQAVNSVIQGTASDLIKYAMINVDRQLAAHWSTSSSPSTGTIMHPAKALVPAPVPRVLMQIHDELIYEVSAADPQYLVRFEQLLHSAMEGQVAAALKLTVPLVANVHTGISWGDIDC